MGKSRGQFMKCDEMWPVMKWVISLMGCDTYSNSVGQPDGTGDWIIDRRRLIK